MASSEPRESRRAAETETYCKPCVSWEQDLDLHANLAAACDKTGEAGEQCSTGGGS